MRDLHTALQSLRSAFICASAALLIVACGDSSDKEQNPNPGTSTSSNAGSGGTNGNTKPAEKKGLGAACEKAEDCESNNCRAFSIVPDPAKPEEKVEGKTCSACNADADCTDPAKGNLCVPALSTRSPASLHFVCGKGELGGGCIDNANCSESRVCGKVLGDLKTCGECVTSADCKDAAKPNCVVKREGIVKAWRECAEKLADGEVCSGEDGSDEECQNYCAPITSNLIPIKIGVCSPCREDSHCAAGQKCKAPGADSNLNPIPAKCEAAEQGNTGAATGTENNTSGATTTTTTENNTASSTDSTT